MRIQKIIAGVSLLFITNVVLAQKHELGKVTVSELEQKQHPKDTSAVAAILFKIGESKTRDVGGTYVSSTKVSTKIKIYTKEGLEWANQSVAYFSIGNNENVDFDDAATYNLVDGKVVKTKLKSDGQFAEKIDKYFSQKKISFPNVKEGSIIEFSYVIKSYGFSIPKRWDFQSTIPVDFCEYKTYIPQYFIYKKNQKGFIFPKVTEEKINNAAGFYDNVTTYVAQNFPAIKKEAYVNNIYNYVSSVSHELSSIDIPQRGITNISTNWEQITSDIFKMDDFGLELNKKGYFEEDIAPLIKGLEKRDDKIAAIFNYVKSNIKWNKYYGYTCDNGVKSAYKDKQGNVAEINLMLIAMLRYAGIDTNPVLLSTQSNGVVLFPSRTAFNYVIAAVEIQDDLILLDATEEFGAPNILPVRDLNWNGRLIRNQGSSTEVDLFPKEASKTATNMSATLNAQGVMEGKLRMQLTNHDALQFRQNNKNISNDTYLETLENNNNAIEIDQYSRDNFLDASKQLFETYTFKDHKSVEMIDGKMYFSPLLFLAIDENPFKAEIREYPIDFNYPFQKKYNISITLPEGYGIETLPDVVSMSTEDDLGAFKYIIAAAENKIQVSIVMDINKSLIASDFYEVMKGFYQKLVEKENEKIVLVKI